MSFTQATAGVPTAASSPDRKLWDKDRKLWLSLIMALTCVIFNRSNVSLIPPRSSLRK